MFNAFFLFWPANVIPIWLLIILMQLFIPLKMFIGACLKSVEYYKIHIYSSLIILFGIILGMINFKVRYH